MHAKGMKNKLRPGFKVDESLPTSLVAFITAGFFFHPILAIFFCTFNTVLGGLVNFFTIKRTFNLRHNKRVNKMAKNLEIGLKKIGFNEDETSGILGNNWYNFYKGIN